MDHEGSDALPAFINLTPVVIEHVKIMSAEAWCEMRVLVADKVLRTYNVSAARCTG